MHLYGVLSHAVEEVVHHARFGGNTHVHFLGNVFVVVIVAAARGQGEGSKYREGESPDFHCFHFYYFFSVVNVSTFINAVKREILHRRALNFANRRA